ncbi:hypothetical protein SDC9_66337 [bioreactor metagenome]|uniref:Uncharacterized protein n=1 Tax=bioreactor metagenome TaxID=1076179 RepID=A0A644XUL9_9ZZZZ
MTANKQKVGIIYAYNLLRHQTMLHFVGKEVCRTESQRKRIRAFWKQRKDLERRGINEL